jgi:hypothetical protein
MLSGEARSPLIASQDQAVQELLSEHPSSGSLLEAARSTVERGEELARRQLQVLPPDRPIACHEGCAWCCNVRVEVSVPELALLVDFLRRTRGPEELSRLAARVTALAADPRVKSKDQKPQARIACALLESGRCSAYDARPLACRGCTSYDASSCERSLDDPDEAGAFYYPQLETFMSLSLGLLRGLFQRKLGTEVLELTSGLSIALGDPGAIERWIAGEPVFDPARVDV